MNVNKGRSLTRSEHLRHDRLLVTRFAMGDAYPSERDEASALVDKCAECAELAADVKLIANSVARVPVAPRTRDFMITAEQADKLRGGRVSRWLRSFGTPGWAMLRPVAGVALSIGLVMAVVGAGIPGVQPATQTFGDREADSGAQPVLPAPAATNAPPPGDAGVISAPGEREVEYAQASADPITQEVNSAYVDPTPAGPVAADEDQAAAIARVDGNRELLLYGGLSIALLSIALLALAMIARRYFADPLLR